MNLKPFNLEEALANPNRVVTRIGGKVTQLTKFDVNDDFCIAGVFEDNIRVFTKEGNFFEDEVSDYDLFLLPQTKTLWVVVFNLVNGIIMPAIYNSKEEAIEEKIKVDYISYSKPTPIEIEI